MGSNIQIVTKEIFAEIFQEKLGNYWERAYKLFCDCGDFLSWDVSNVLHHAVDQGKVEEVLKILEKHYDEYLYFQHPELRGQVVDLLLGGNNPTENLFRMICEQVLGLTKNQS